jgi:outer membrane protein
MICEWYNYICAKINQMKNISGVLNVILLIAVAVLYYLHFKGAPQTEVSGEKIKAPVHVSGAGVIAFVNSDTLFDEYEFYKDQKAAIETEKTKIKNELKAQSDRLQNEVEAYQKAAMGMTEKERAEKEYQLGMKQQAMMQHKEELLNALDEKREQASDTLYTKLNNYLKKHNNKNNYSYILGYSKGGGILFANDSLEITKEVLDGLNKEYKESKGLEK